MSSFDKIVRIFSSRKEKNNQYSDQLDSIIKNLNDLNRNVLKLGEQLSTLDSRQTVDQKPNKKPKPAPKGESIAIIGVRGHGTKHIANYNKLKNCYISWICDVDAKVGKSAVEQIFKTTGYRPKFTTDYREMLKDQTVVAVSIASPHHGHALQAIHALQAGKHVYLEKPLTHTYSERFSLEVAAQKYGKIVQSGTQLRSNMSLKSASEFMLSGGIGDIDLVHCIIHKDRPPVPLTNEQKIPATVDYDLWCGPRASKPVNRSKFHYHWHWLWDFGNGALGNNGIHRIDAARIALDLRGYGEKVVSIGGRYGPEDSGETPNNMLTLHKFGRTWILQDILGLKPEPYNGMENAVIFYGSKGTIVYKTGYAALVDENFSEIKRFEGKQLNHYYNFLSAIRENDSSIIRGKLSEGLISGDLCHFGNASYRVGSVKSFEDAEKLLSELEVPPFVNERLDALKRNLDQNRQKMEITIGEVLELGTVGEENPILNSPHATRFLSTDSTKEFEYPLPKDV